MKRRGMLFVIVLAAGLASCRPDEQPSMVVWDVGAAGNEAVMLASVTADRQTTYRVVRRRLGTLESSAPIGPTSLATIGEMVVDGDAIVVALLYRSELSVAALATDTLQIQWVRRFPGVRVAWPVLAVDAERVLTWVHGPTALDRETGETRWSQSVGDYPRALRIVGRLAAIELTSSLMVVDDNGRVVANIGARHGVCSVGGTSVGLDAREGTTFLWRATMDTRANTVERTETEAITLAGHHIRQCVRVGDDWLLVVGDDERRYSALLITGDGEVRWRGVGPGLTAIHEPRDSIPLLPRDARFIPVPAAIDGDTRVVLFDITERRWIKTRTALSYDSEVIPLPDCWLVAGKVRAVTLDPRTGDLLARRDYPISELDKRGPFLWAATRNAKRTTRYHGCTLTSSPF